MIALKRFLTTRNILIAVLVLGAVLRFWGINSAEIFHDEGLYAFRSIGYFDYIQNQDQTQPVQWFKDLKEMPFWTNLSFHDAPPLFFLTQHLSFNVFGENLFAARLPSVLAGIILIYLIFLTVKVILRDEKMALLAAFFASINHAMVWISRSSLMESVLFCLVAFNFYAFLKIIGEEKQGKWWWIFGVSLGLCFLTKYTAVFLIPAYALYILFFEAKILREWRFYAGSFLAFLIFLPVIIYNIYLYKSTGHFDLQIAYALGQKTPEWQASIGKIQEPFNNFVSNLLSIFTISSLFAFLGAVALSAWLLVKKQNNLAILGWLAAVFMILMFILTGTAFRFVALFSLPLVITTILAFSYLKEKFDKSVILKVLLAVFLAYELFFTVGGLFFEFPDYGVVKLDKYFDETFGDVRSAAMPNSPNPHLEKVIKDNLVNYKASTTSFMVVFDENIILSTKLWVFARRNFYHGIPAIATGQFKNFLQTAGESYFKGYDIYFVKASPYTAINPNIDVPEAGILENFLRTSMKLNPIKIIYDRQNIPMYFVYKFTL
ncbi:MAG: glycosyltransferase family 39 protein [Candidatus Pacebacteria bacterium]|nr:glycosyltransferase family 39 protein [Candidatus Paceibacterota bacterium]